MLLGMLLAAAAPDCSGDSLNQAVMNDCALARFNEADAKLNQQWKTTLGVFQKQSSNDAKRLLAAQRAWIAFRDAECDVEFPWDIDVSMDKMMNVDCRTALTIDRTKKLAELAKGN